VLPVCEGIVHTVRDAGEYFEALDHKPEEWVDRRALTANKTRFGKPQVSLYPIEAQAVGLPERIRYGRGNDRV